MMAKTKASTGKTAKKPSTVKTAAAAKVKRNAATGQFVAAKTGRVVKLSPATSHLGSGRIRAAVQTVVTKRTSY